MIESFNKNERLTELLYQEFAKDRSTGLMNYYFYFRQYFYRIYGQKVTFAKNASWLYTTMKLSNYSETTLVYPFFFDNTSRKVTRHVSEQLFVLVMAKRNPK